MNSSTLLRISALSVLLGFAAFTAPAQQAPATTGDPVADAARKARAEQKTAPKPKKVFTNDDIPSSVPAPPPATTATTDATKTTGGQAQVDNKSGKKELDPEDDPKQQAYWQKRARTLHTKLSNAEQELDVLQRELSKDEVQYYPDPQKALQQQYSRSDINEKHAKVDAKKAEVESLKQQVANLEDDVRKAGGDPGWVL